MGRDVLPFFLKLYGLKVDLYKQTHKEKPIAYLNYYVDNKTEYIIPFDVVPEAIDGNYLFSVTTALGEITITPFWG